MIWMRTFSLSQAVHSLKFCPSDYQNNLVLSPNHPPFTFFILQKSGVHFSIKKDAWTQCKGASSQAGQKKSALAECPYLARVKTHMEKAYGKGKWMRNALSGRISTWCGVLQDGLLDKSLPLFNMPCANLSSTLLNFPLDSIYQEHSAGSIFFFHSSFHLLFLLLCFILSQAESAGFGKFSCLVLLFYFPPMLASCLCSVSFTLWVCTDWPAALVYVYLGLGATCKPFALSSQYSWFNIRVAWLVNEVTEPCLCSLIRWLNLC